MRKWGVEMTDQIKSKLVKTYDRYAQERDASEPQEWKIKERDEFLQEIEQEEKQSLLEIGSGTGRDGKFFKEQGFKVVTTDLSPAMVKLCQEKGLRAYVMDFYNLEFIDGTFDAVWALNCLLHVPKEDIITVLQGIERILRPEGYFYLGVYGGPDQEGVWEDDYYQPPRFFSFHTDEQIQELAGRVFEVVRFKTIPVEGEIHFQSLILKKRL